MRGESGRRSPTTRVGERSLGQGFEVWEYWWENNKDRFLNLKSRLSAQTTVSGSIGAMTGKGKHALRGCWSRRPDRFMVESDVIPALLELVHQSQDRDVLDSAVLALARTSDAGSADAVVDVAMPLLAHSELSVQSSTALSLGVLGSPKAVPALLSLMRDDSEGRKLSGGKVHWLVRAFSALSLGMIGDANSVCPLMHVVEQLPDSDRDIKVCALVGLGLVEGDLKPEVVRFLMGLLDERNMDPLIASYIPTSLGKLGDPAAVQPLLALFSDRDTDNLIRASVAVGLGQLASMGDESVLETLTDYVKEGRDQQTRHFALISLAQIGARDGSMDFHPQAHADLTMLLCREIQGHGRSRGHRSWAAIAAALYSRAHDDIQGHFIARIEAAYLKESNLSFKSAFAVALGLLNDASFGEQIFEDFNRRKEPDFRGYASVALGFMNHAEASDALRGICQDKTTQPSLRLQASTGLGLMSDTRAVSTLIDSLETAKTLGVSSAVAKALGLIGDKGSIEALKQVANDERQQKLTRAFACVALGIIGEKNELPWNAAISAHNNYCAKLQSMDEVLDIL